MISPREIRNILSEVKDPEVPVLSIEELGVLRDVAVHDNKVEITITPTYSGCPAMQVIENEISEILVRKGIQPFSIKTILSPPWTTDWMTQEAKSKLKAYGIAPPDMDSATYVKSLLEGKHHPVHCPFCNSDQTTLTSAFGSTACKALHYCNHCHQPFEAFKCH